MHTRRSVLAGAASALLFPTSLNALPASDTIVTQTHSLQLHGRRLLYNSISGRLPLADDRGIVRGRMFFAAYRMQGKSGKRPVTFIWNGGPGQPAATLHFRSWGPKRFSGEFLVDNADTLLATSDLVFVDPVGTGYSRPERDEDAPLFYSTTGDVTWATRFVRAWRDRFGSPTQPLYAIGESFGVPRVAGLADALTKAEVPLRGVILISGGKIPIDARLPWPLRIALQVPAKAMTAFYHGKLPVEAGANLDQVRQGALAWARSSYAPALARLSDLTEAERNRIATELARWTGLEPYEIDRSTLTIETQAFRRNLLPAQTLYAYDMRVIGSPLTEEQTARRTATIRRYLSEELGYHTELAYWPLDPGQPPVNASWKYTGDREAILEAAAGGGPPERQPWLSRAIARNHALRAMVVTAIWDSQNQCEADRALLELATPVEQRAIAARCYVGGHAPFDDAPTRTEMARDLAAFLKS